MGLREMLILSAVLLLALDAGVAPGAQAPCHSANDSRNGSESCGARAGRSIETRVAEHRELVVAAFPEAATFVKQSGLSEAIVACDAPGVIRICQQALATSDIPDEVRLLSNYFLGRFTTPPAGPWRLSHEDADLTVALRHLSAAMQLADAKKDTHEGYREMAAESRFMLAIAQVAAGKTEVARDLLGDSARIKPDLNPRFLIAVYLATLGERPSSEDVVALLESVYEENRANAVGREALVRIVTERRMQLGRCLARIWKEYPGTVEAQRAREFEGKLIAGANEYMTAEEYSAARGDSHKSGE